jgi:hypothetical protein
MEAQARYTYFVDIASKGWKEYMNWRHHDGWSGLYLKGKHASDLQN